MPRTWGLLFSGQALILFQNNVEGRKHFDLKDMTENNIINM
jgi:hypothetical protein